MKLHRPTIGAAIITKNEAENLPKLIASLKDCVDQIVITDTGSTDNTVEIAKSLGCEVNYFEWCNDFSQARNASFEPMTTDYILWIDGDDVLEDPKSFITWRDEIMHLADMWLVNYIYSSDENDKPICTFVRERVVKREGNFKWKYFVHEGLTPQPTTKVQFIPSWRIRHRRTSEDLNKDRSRNLSLMEANQDKIDGRMMFYWGKELFEAEKPFEAIRKFEDCLVKPNMEAHDRILAMQYLCFCYVRFEQYDKAISLALTGLHLAPQRAEFCTLVGDCLLKQGRLADAIPIFYAAMNCHLPEGPMVVSPMFAHADAYGLYPRNQLARIYANLGNLEKSKEMAVEAFHMYKHPESKQILDEINRIATIVDGSKTAKPCEDIVFSGTPVSPYVWDGEEYRSKGMGGSETACIEMAEWMAKLSGRKVKVFNARADIKTVEGVEYLPVNLLNQYMAENKPYLHIAWRHNIKLTEAPTFVWCHDLITPGVENTSQYVKTICLTPFHANFMHSMQMVPYDKIWTSRNGLNPTRFLGPKKTKNPNKIVFPSSPDRGLDRAMLVLDEVRKEFPDIELHVFYGIEHLPQYNHKPLHDKLLSMFKSRPWVKYHGKTPQKDLIEHFKEASIWLHPCDFIETSCITAMEMIASGVYPVTRRLGGLKDTLKAAEDAGLATLLDSDCVKPEEFKLYVDATLDALRNKKWENSKFAEFNPESLSWKNVAQEWLSELPKMAGIADTKWTEPKSLRVESGFDEADDFVCGAV